MDSPCPIQQLPNELLLDIFELLPVYGQRNILLASQVCSRWHSLISSSSKLMSRVTLWLGPRNYPDMWDVCQAYDNYLSRSVRPYRKLMIVPHDKQSLCVGVLAVRKFGPHLRKLSFSSVDMIDGQQLTPYDQMRELELGLEEEDRLAWAQELDSLNRSLLPIDEYRMEMEPISPGLHEDVREIEEMFYAVTYRYCSRLEEMIVESRKATIHNHLRRYSLYDENQMEHLEELWCTAGHLVLTKSPSLRLLHLYHVKAGPPFYASLGHTFPMLTHLEIRSTVFDDPCLWAVSQHCSQIKQLDLSSDKLTEHGLRYIHQLRKLKNLSITLDRFGCRDTFDGPEAPPLEKLSICCHEAKLENIHRMFDLYVNLKEFRINAVRYTYARIEVSTSPLLQVLRAIRPTCNINFFGGNVH